MSLREAREAAVKRYLRALEDDWRKALPRLLDELDTIDREHLAAAVKVAKPEIEKTLGRTRTRTTKGGAT